MADDEATTLVRLGDTDLTLAAEVDDVRGRTVLDRNGDETGDVEGLIIDQRERRVRFLEVSSGGFLGMGKKRVLVPVDAVTSVDDEHVYINQDREHVASGPVYDPELTPEPERPYEDVYGYYGTMPYWGAGYIYPGYPYR
ncbi:PRC-barrel domain-containing protein [Glycomyces arizonensis]|uniref:PRC-barrel domain-containing protein n=1 Tax=Glycomyces arizonensis TaxID=256035 RepID=UPI000405E63D|nr:PRC-barrel domain-containing protein [Glycomyces arizonensis]